MKINLQKGVYALLLLFSAVLVQAQQVSITGTVSDQSDGIPLIGANVLVKGTLGGTITDVEGNFELEAKTSDTLVITYTGYISQEIPVNGQEIFSISLNVDAQVLDEVVVMGFGTQKRENVTGAASFVQLDDIIGDRPLTNSAQALEGVAAGLQVVNTSGQPGANNTALRIRGYMSINGGSPLVLVNNVPMSLNDVNPRDIESVSVLKDASATSIYGARAAFGVILITTKQASRNQPTQFSYSTTNSISRASELPEKATTREFVQALSDFGVDDYFAGQNVDKWLNYLDTYDSDPSSLTYLKDPVSGENYPIAFDEANNNYYALADSDFIGDFLNDQGYNTLHNLTFSGGSDRISYRVNGGFSFEDGIMVTDKDQFTNYNINAFLGADLTKNLKSTTNIFYKNSNQIRPIAQYASAIQGRMYDPTGFFETSAGDIIPFDSPGNFVRYRTPSTTDNNNQRFFQKLEFTPVKNFTLTGEYTYEKRIANNFSANNGTIFASSFKFIPNTSAENAFQNSRISRSEFNTSYNSLNLYGKYDMGFGKHNINLLAGFNRENSVNKGFASTRTGLIDPTLPTFNLAIGDVYDISDSYGDWAVMGYFGRVNYNYDNKYFLEANGRYDGSSRFPNGSQFVLLPSFSVGWNLAKEAFLAPVEQLSMLKLRASWGEIGNQQTADFYPSISGYEDFQASWVNLDNDQQYLTLRPGQLVSNSFTWEKVRTSNIGVDIAFFQDKLNFSGDIYKRETIGMLSAGADLPATLGTEAPDQNIADLETRGWEVELGWRDGGNDFRYGINFNLSDNQSKITKFFNESGIISNFYVGKDPREIWGYVTDGYYTVDDFVGGTLDAHLSGPNRQLKEGVVQIENAPTPYPGDIKYKDLNGDGVINAGNGTLEGMYDESGNLVPNTGPGDVEIIGNSNRRYLFGINGNVGYKGLDLSFVLSGVGKRDLWRDSDVIWPYPSVFDNIYKHQLDYWTPDNQDAFYPRVYGEPNGNTGSNYGRSRRVQTKYLSNESYMRIQNITIGYAIPKKILSRVKLQQLRVFVAGNNIHTFDHLPKGLDPDYGSNGVYPLMSNYSIGLNTTF
ncbi:SusC/RagA family TonB-linked outer membrane protein [Portibacter lacus]|uniref:SusC/RagA family TonB-linked outer membrane protein n=1 Tax=Portibacter lacus TaxID=1099794 RepID=A0AA37SRU4_9BACT|nr:TonB-dependent receptor [Portibacter lacus]GLR18892.1 SusC/RagA family TonB-linked outer membrane protein [Portibacter lacus]